MTSTILSLLNKEAMEDYYRNGHWRHQTIYDIAREAAERGPGHPAVRDRFRSLGRGELVRAADRLAADLARRGVRAGQRVVFWMPDRLDSVVAVLACSRNGYVCCPSPHRNHTVAQVAELMERMGAAALIYETGFGADADTADIIAATRRLPSLRHVYQLAPAAGHGGLPTDDAEGPPPLRDPDRVG